MKKQDIYQLLEAKMLSFNDYADMLVAPVDEPLVPIAPNEQLAATQLDMRMLAFTGPKVYVRAGVLERLRRAGGQLAKRNPTLRLEVVYGYRALAIQKELFEKNKRKLQKDYSGRALLEAAHRLVAVPTLAGHPAGAAVDIRILQDGVPLDFGTEVWQFVPDSYTFSPFISKTAWKNRQLLREVMLQAGFAPFDGEWWHFSYGDKEWAKFYQKPAAIYEQIDFAPPNK